jgi:hypothetical protein
MNIKINSSTLAFFIVLFILSFFDSFAQMNFEGNFMFRWYSDRFTETMDNRGNENYIRSLGKIRGNIRSTRNITFNTEVITIVESPNALSARNIMGSGKLNFSISKIYAELIQENFLYMDIVRVRLGRQPFKIGSGLSFGESYYFLEKFDGARVDAAYKNFSISLFGAITGQNLSQSGLSAEPGSDQIYAARLTANYFDQDIMGYFIKEKLRGMFNDNYIIGGGFSGAFLKKRLDYFVEFAHQTFNTPPSFPEKGGIGYMAGIGYRWALGPFRTIKVETRYAAYQGDDASTEKVEMFSPSYPSFWWGDRSGYVNGAIGGYYPNRGKNLEGGRIWFSRIYFIPRALPDLRVQFQYLINNEYVDNNDYNTYSNEFSTRVYYKLMKNAQVQLRYTIGIPNGKDKDLNNSGIIAIAEDRIGYHRFMMELLLVF